MTRGDKLLVALLALAIVASVPVSAGALAVRSGRGVKVTAPAGVTTLDLAKDGRYTVAGRAGTVVLQVADGSVRCVEASCPDGVCVRMGAARPGKPVVCAPNAVTVAVSRGGAGGLDAVSR